MTGDAIDDADTKLALLYVPTARRSDVAAILVLDRRMESIVARTREPMLAAIKLAWWRERVEALPAAPGGEPLLAALADAVRAGVPQAAIARIVEGWETVLGGDAADGHAGRGAALFAAIAVRLGDGAFPVAESGAVWALMDAARRGAATRDAAAMRQVEARWPGMLRPLGMLAMLAAGDARAAVPPPQGTPARAARMAWHRIRGR